MPTDFAMLEELINRKSAAESKNLDNLCLAEIEDAVAGKLLDALFYMKKILENTTGEDKSYTEEILYKLSDSFITIGHSEYCVLKVHVPLSMTSVGVDQTFPSVDSEYNIR